MFITMSLFLILGVIVAKLFTKLKLPGLIGLLLLGILSGPYVLNLIDAKVLSISAELRKIALIVILLRAGLGISRETLQKVGRTAVKMSFIPGIFEGFTIAVVSIYLLGFTFTEGAVLGFIIAAVSPAVVVPLMLNFIGQRLGEKSGVPTLILASASIDDIVAITFFSAFLGILMEEPGNLIGPILNIPLSILSGVGLGIAAGLAIVYIFNKIALGHTQKIILLLGCSTLLIAAEDALHGHLAIASLLSIMTMGFVIRERVPQLAKQLTAPLGSIWEFSKILLFVLVGATVNINIALEAGAVGLAIIMIGLSARSIGVLISTAGSSLSPKERLFSVIAYTPKATVQAAIGAIPLSLGLPAGEIILAIAVLSILVTAPLGAIAIKYAAPKLLDHCDDCSKPKLKLVADDD